MHIARAELLRRQGRDADALAAYEFALAAELPLAERDFLARRVADVGG